MNYTLYTESSEIDGARWDALLAQSRYASFFQSRAYYAFMQTLSCLAPFVYAVAADGRLDALVCGYVTAEKGVKRYFSRRAIVLGGVVMRNDADRTAIDLLLGETVNQLKRKAIYIEIRNNHDYGQLQSVFEHNGFVYRQHYNFKIDTGVPDALANIGKSRFRDERAALLRGVTITTQPTKDDLKQWYGILARLYRNRIGKPLFPYEFFERISECDFSKFFFVKVGEKVVGGTLCVCYGNDSMYEWYACGLDREGYSQYAPSTACTMASIRYSIDKGFRVFDMLGAGVPDEAYGVRNFKKHFGGKLVEEGRFLYLCNHILYRIGTWTVRYVQCKFFW